MRGVLVLLPAFLFVPQALAAPSATWNPPSNLVTPLQQVWDHEMATYNNGNALGFKNYGYDQLFANQGKINYCVRLETTRVVDEATRKNIQTALQRSIGKWMSWLYGFDGFPYTNVPVNVVGYAVRDRNQITGNVNGLDIYTNIIGEGAPQCAPACGRFFHQDNNYSGCAGDMSLWLTDGFSGGAGGDWGQRIGTEYFFGAINQDNIHILLHEMGHTFALDDFYDWTPQGQTNFIMLAGSATQITDFDGWMLRDWWRHLKSRYGISGLASDAAPLTIDAPANATLNFVDSEF